MLERWEELFNNFKTYYPILATHAVDFYCSGPLELTIKMDDGRKVIYSDSLETIRFLRFLEDPTANEEDWRIIFSENLNRMIKKRHMTCKELSKLTGISRPTISNMVRGKSTPNSYNVQLIAEALQCSVSELYYFN